VDPPLFLLVTIGMELRMAVAAAEASINASGHTAGPITRGTHEPGQGVKAAPVHDDREPYGLSEPRNGERNDQRNRHLKTPLLAMTIGS
jgi:hypothetical protein